MRLEENHIRVEMKIQYLLLLWKTHREYHSHVNKYPSYLIPLSSMYIFYKHIIFALAALSTTTNIIYYYQHFQKKVKTSNIPTRSRDKLSTAVKMTLLSFFLEFPYQRMLLRNTPFVEHLFYVYVLHVLLFFFSKIYYNKSNRIISTTERLLNEVTLSHGRNLKFKINVQDQRLHFSFRLLFLLGLNHEMPVNIAIQMIDSESRANFQRQAVKTMEFLENDDDAFVFESNSILGDGTPAQIMPLLTGTLEYQIIVPLPDY